MKKITNQAKYQIMPWPKVIVSGGGTGGHIFPAVAIANAIKAKHPEADILFVGAEGRMEMEKVPAAGYPIKGLKISGIQRKLTLKNLLFPFKLANSLLKARGIIKAFKPDIVIGTGGYASGPTLRIANAMGIPTLIQEQNSFAGVTNKWVAKQAQRICVAYDGMERFFPKKNIRKYGNPVREEVIQISGKREEAIKFFNLDPNKRTLLIIGGSLGAKSINDALLLNIETLKNSDIQLLWQTGKTTYSEVKQGVDSSGADNLHITEFITRMDLAYAAADLVITRAGAIAVSEITLVGLPSILVPLPHAAEDHQTKNALSLAQHDAGVLVPNNKAKTVLVEKALELIDNTEELEKISENIRKLALPDAANKIADEALSIAKKPKG